MIDTRAVMRSLPLVASVLGRKYGVKVEMGGADAYTDGKTIHHVGVPIHWGFASQGRKGHMANNLTASVGDGNSFTPESKTFLVKVEKV